ncbi:MAG: YggT family protein [Bacteriovoracaceae bacterium]
MILIHGFLQLYIYIIIIDVIMSYFPQMRGQVWAQKIHQMADVSLRPVREMMPANLPFDISPMIVIIVIQILKSVL